MESRTRFSLARFSLGSEDRTVPVSARFDSALKSVVGRAIRVETRGGFASALRGRAVIAIAVRTALTASGELTAHVKMTANAVVSAAFPNALAGRLWAGKDTFAALTAAEALSAKAFLSKNIPAAASLTDALTARTDGVKNTPIRLHFGEILTALPDAGAQLIDTLRVQLTLPPGAELRIDSERYTVLLDGENVLYTQSGDWIKVSRELRRLLIESAAGNALEGRLMYQERFL